MAFDGIVFQGQSLKIRRPRDYQAGMTGVSREEVFLAKAKVLLFSHFYN